MGVGVTILGLPNPGSAHTQARTSTPTLKVVGRGASGATVDLLLQRGAGDTRDANGESALVWALRACRVTRVQGAAPVGSHCPACKPLGPACFCYQPSLFL